MKFHGLCLFVLLSTSPAVQAQTTLAKESDENLDKVVQSFEKQIQAKYQEMKAIQDQIQDQIDELRNKQAPFLAERNRRSTRKWQMEYSKHFDTVEIRGKLTESGGWQVVVNDRPWSIQFPEPDKDLLAAAEKLINKGVIITGSAIRCYKSQQPARIVNPPAISSKYPPIYAITPPPEYRFVVSATSLQPAPMAAKQKEVEAIRDRIDLLSKKSDDVLTKREYDELVGLREKLKKLKVLQAELEWSDKRTHYARVQFRGKLLKEAPDTWHMQIGSPSLFSIVDWRINFGNKNELKALAAEQEGKRVVVTGTITADNHAPLTVNVEALKRPED